MNPWEDPRVRDGLPRQLALLAEAEREGARRIGWKVGFGAPASLELMQIEAPLLGFLTDRTLLADAAEVEVGDWVRGVVEFEVAVRIDATLGTGTTREEAKDAVGALAPSIELADVHLAPGPDVVGDILESDIFHRAVIVGPWDEGRRRLDIDGLLARIEVDGAPFAETSDLQAITGPYDEVVATVANTLGAFGEELRAGDLIITGSVIPPVSVGDGTDFVFALDPLPALSVRCTG